jgi:hypothetical protein
MSGSGARVRQKDTPIAHCASMSSSRTTFQSNLTTTQTNIFPCRIKTDALLLAH